MTHNKPSLSYIHRFDIIRLRFGSGVSARGNSYTATVGPSVALRRPQFDTTERGVEFHYKTRRGRNRIYGGKVIENMRQAIARCIIGEQMLKIAKKHRVVLTVHDSVVCCVRDDEVEEAQAYVEDCMRWIPDWAEGLPINCESGVGKSYGDCE